MRRDLAVVLPFISVAPIYLGTYGIYMGTALEPPGSQILIGIGSLGVLTGSALCLTVYAALRHDQN